MVIDPPTNLELVHELLRGGREDDDAAGAGVDEALLHGLVDEGQQRVVVAVHVQQPNLRASKEGSLGVLQVQAGAVELAS